MQSGGKSNEGSLIYVALSKCKRESMSHLRKQLRMLHLMLISAGTRTMFRCLRENTNYDILNSSAVRE